MLNCMKGWAIWLALLLFTWAQTASAHGLPASEIVFGTAEQGISLTITLPVEDLVIAAPTLAALEDLPPESTLAATDLEALGTYFEKHLTLAADNQRLSLAVEMARTSQAVDHHIGEYALLHVRFAALPDVPQITVTYDAIMHEVRSHRARIAWETAEGEEHTITDFGFRPLDGVQTTLQIARP